MAELPWVEKVPMLSINPDAATVEDVARLASELTEAMQTINQISDIALSEKPDIANIGVLCFHVLDPIISLKG